MFFRTCFTSPYISYRQQIQSVIITDVRYKSCNKFTAHRLSVFMHLADMTNPLSSSKYSALSNFVNFQNMNNAHLI